MNDATRLHNNRRQRRALLNLRRRINPQRRFSVKLLGEGWFEYTCRTCGCAFKKQHKDPSGRVLYTGSANAEAIARKFAAYQNDSAGASGRCKRCSKKARDKRYPLPPLFRKEG